MYPLGVSPCLSSKKKHLSQHKNKKNQSSPCQSEFKKNKKGILQASLFLSATAFRAARILVAVSVSVDAADCLPVPLVVLVVPVPLVLLVVVVVLVAWPPTPPAAAPVEDEAAAFGEPRPTPSRDRDLRATITAGVMLSRTGAD